MTFDIFRETNQLTRTKARSHSKLLLTLGVGISAFLTFCFFSMGIVQTDPLYGEMPVFASIPLLAVGSFNAVAFTFLSILFVKSFSEVSVSKFKNHFEERNNAKIEFQAKAITNRIDQFGQKDYSLQINEIKQGFQFQLEELRKWFQSQIDSRVSDFIRQIGILNLKIEKSERRRIHAESEAVKQRVLKEDAEQKLKEKETNELKILERLDTVSAELLDVKEELKRLRDNRDR
jgi:hypothetical protein